MLYQPYLSNEPTQTTAASASAIYNTAAQNVTLSATVIFAGGNISQGTETFTVLSGSTPIGSPVTVNVTNGVATATYPLPAATAPGTYTIQAVYNGTSLFAGSSDSSHLLTVSAAATTTAAANASITYSTASQNVALSATVTSPGGTVNEGTETFTVLSGSTVVGSPITANVAGGAASVNYALPAGTAGGTYTIQAVYNGTSNFSTSVDTSHSLNITAGSTTTAANASVTYSTSGQSASLSATVTSPGGTVNTGTVTFTVLNGTTVVGTAVTANVVNGAASATYALPAGTSSGTYTIQAVYNGTANFTSSTDTGHTLTVSSAATTTAGVSAGAVFSAASQAVALSATVTTPTGTVNEGMVTFTVLNGSTVVGTAQSANVVNGVASVNYTLPAGLADGSYTIQVAYGGSANFTASTDSSHSLFVGTIMWVAPGGGSWDTASNWSANRLPTATDDVVIVQPGATVTESGGNITVQSVMSTAALSFSSTSMTITAGQSQFQAGLTLTSGTFNFNGGSISGTVTLALGSALNIGSGSTGAGSFLFEGSGNSFSGTLAAGQMITVQSNGTYGAAILNLADGSVNDGTIDLIADYYYSSYYAELNSQSTFTNDGTIEAQQGISDYNYLAGNFVNQGTITVDAGSALTAEDGIFTQSSGTLNVTGSFQASSGTFNFNGGTLNVTGSFQASSGTFNYNGGSSTGNPIDLIGSETLNGSADASGSISFLVESAGNTLTGTLAQGVTVTVQSNGYYGAAILDLTDGSVNDGTIDLIDGYNFYGWYAELNSQGTFTNDGIIEAQQGSGSYLYLAGNFVNQGTVTVDAGSALTAEDGIFTQSSGTLNISGNWSDSSETFNLNGGTVNVPGTLSDSNTTFNFNSGSVNVTGSFLASSGIFNFNGGSPTGNALALYDETLNASANASGPATFLVEGSNNTLTGTLTQGVTVIVQSNGTYGAAILNLADGSVNDGTIDLIDDYNYSYYYAQLNSQGTFTNDGTIEAQQGSGSYLYLAGNFVNQGTVTVDAGSALTVQAGTFTQSSGTLNVYGSWTANDYETFTLNGGTLNVTGSFQASSGTFNYNGGSSTGNPIDLISSETLNASANASGPATFLVEGSNNTLTGTLAQGVTVTVQSGDYGAAILNLADGSVNDGTIDLIDGYNFYAYYAELNSQGTFTNDGTIEAQQGSGDYNYLVGNFVNQGTITVDAGSALTAQDGIFAQSSGTLNVTGSFQASSGTFNFNGGTLNVTGSFQASSGTFNYNGGSSTGNPIDLISSETLNASANASGPATFLVEGSNNTLTGTLVQGVTVTVQSGDYGAAILNLADGSVNDGTIDLIDGYNFYAYYAELNSQGTFTNDGTIEAQQGSGNFLYLAGTILNYGLIGIAPGIPLTLSSGASLTNEQGALISGGGTLSTSGATFVNNGTVDLIQPSVLDEELYPSNLQITYVSENGMNASTVTNPANYTIVGSGGTGTFGNSHNVNEDDLISGIAYDSTTGVATISFSQSLPADLYQITINGTAVQDNSGNALYPSGPVVLNRLLGLLPAAAVVSVDPASDSGAPDHPGYTHDTTPTFDVQVNQAGTLAIDFDGNGTIDATQSAPIPGTYQFTAPELADGTYTATLTFNTLTGLTSQSSTTYTIDTVPPSVTALSPSGPVYTGMSQATVTFNEPVDLNTFTPGAITLTGPGGAVAVSQPQLVSGTTYRIDFPQQTAQGTYTLTIASSVTDYAGNAMQQPFTGSFTIGLPDLAVTATSSPASVEEGGSTAVSWTVTDLSATNPAVSTWTDAVYLSTHATLDNTATLLLNVAAPPSSPLAANGEYVRNESVVIPTNIPTGDYYLLFVANADGGQLESDAGQDSNDVVADPITLQTTATTTTAAAVSATYAVASQTVYLNALVTSSGVAVNEGTETFTLLNGSTVVGSPVTVNVSNGAAAAAYTLPAGTPAGAYTIQAVYNGTANLLSSSDTSQSLTVKPAFTTTSAVNTLVSYSTADQTVSLDASVTSPAGTVNEGTETFTILNGGTAIGNPVSVSVAGGVASANYTLPGGTPDGTYTIQAVYTDTSNFAGSSDTSHSLTVGPAATTTAAVTVSTNFSASSQAVALSATVTSPAVAVNEGSVTFTVLSGSTVIGTPVTANVVNGAASANYTLPAGLADGIYTIQAVYNGTDHFTASTDSSQDLLVGTILWVSSTGGSWDDPNNWLPHRLPQATDEVVIPEAGLTITKTGGSIDVLSVNSQSALSLSGVSLTVTSGASQIAALTMTGASALTAQGAGTTFTVTGATDIDGASVTASGGGQVSLPEVTSLNDAAAGLSGSISALSGGVVSLPHLASVTVTGSGSTANLLADGAGSLLDVPVLTTISGASSLTATNQGTVNAPVLTSLNGTSVTLDGTGVLPTAQIGTLTDGELTVGGGSYDFSGLTHLDDSGVSVSGGILVSLPGVTSYQASGGTLQASGTGSVLALPNLTVLSDTIAGDSGSVQALAGGEVNLPELQAVSVNPASTVSLLADGIGSLLNLPALAGISGPNSMTATHQGIIAAPLLTTLADTTLTLDGSSPLPTSQLVSFTGGQLDLSAAYDFSKLTDLDGSSVLVSGGVSQSFASVTSYQPGTATLEASGAGSVLTLPNLKQLTETDPGTTYTVSALAGGEVSLPALSAVSATGSGSAANLSADGSGSTLNLPDLAALSGNSGTTASLTLSNGAAANVSPAGLTVSTAHVEVGSGATLTGPLILNAGGILGGQGTVMGNVVNNAGTVAPDDPKRIIIHGDYHQGPNGTLALEIEGTTPGTEYDQIVITGTAYLDGTLSVTYLNGYHPQAGDAYQVMTYAAVVGDFATFQQPDMALTEDLTPTSLSLLADAIGVTTTADSGPGSLRQAITDANAQTGPTLIYFNLPGSGVQTIAPLSALPAITGQVLIDGTTQAGYAGTPIIRLNGSASGSADGLVLTGGQSTIRGLAIGGFHDAIVLSGNGNDIVRGNYLGVDTDGTTAFANSGVGVRVSDSSNDLVGGAGPGQGNTIAYNAGAGIAVTGASTGDALRGNVLFGNGGPGIDLGDNGHTPNGSLGHSGPNAYLNFPVLTSATLGQTTIVEGELLADPLITYTLDFYASPVTEADGGARASRYLGSAQVSTDATGKAQFNVSLSAATGPGEYVTATATDPSNDTSELADPLQGTNYNPPPSVTITGPAGSPVGTPVAFQSQVSDAATGRTFTYLWSVTQAGNPSFQLPDQTVVTEPNFTFAPQAVGTYDVTLVVTDNLGATAQASFVLNVTPQPVLVTLTGGPITAAPFTPITLTGTVETAPGTSLAGTPVWSATLNNQPFALPPGGTDAAGQPTLSFVIPGPGNYAVHLSAANTTGGTGSDTFTVVASNGVTIVGLPANSRPTVPLNLSANVDDPSLVGPLTYDWSVTLDGNPYASQHGTDPTLSFTPDQAGTFVFSVTVTDADGRTVSASASTIVPNVLAILDLPDHAFTGQSVALQATGFAPAPASAVHWAVFNAAGKVVGFGTGADFSYVPIDPGVDLITLTSPGQATSATLPILVPSLTVTLSGNPTPPQGSPLTLTADLAGATAGATYAYTWTVTDGNGQLVASGPGTIQGATEGTLTFTPYLSGPYTVRVTVLGSDSSYGAATSSFTVSDVPPTVTLGGAPAGAVPEGTFIHLAALANDAGGTTDVLRFAWTVTGPDGFSQAGSNSTLDFVPVEVGTYAVTVTVTDSSGQSATASTDISVTHVQPVAVISAGPGTHIDPVAGVATIQVLANVPDPGPDGDNFQYSWLVTDDNRGGAVVAQQLPGVTNSPSLTFSGPSADNYTLTLRVTDDDGGDATVVVPIRIGVTSTLTLTNGSVPVNAAMVLGVAYNGTVIDASGLSVSFTGVALGSHDTLIGGAGPNVLQGDSGFNLLEGGTGPNTMYATGGDTLVGGGGTGTDLFALIPPPADAPAAPISLQPDATRQSTLSFAQSATGISFNATLTNGQEQTLATGDQLELFGALQQVVGSAGNDSLVAGSGMTLFGGGGNDTLVASGGSNIALVAGSQADLLAAQGSADLTLFGTSSSNPVVTPTTGTPITLFGGSGQSLLISNNSNNVTLLGGSGSTTLSASGGTNITLFGGSGNSQLTSTNANNVSMIGGTGNATLLASGGTSITLFGGSGNSQLTSTNANNVSMIGGSGNASLTVNAGTSITLFGGSGNSQLTSTNANNVSMIGGSGNTTLSASAGTSITLFGGSGNSQLTSTNANNVSMIGGSGNTTLLASGGTNVTLFGGSGNSQLTSTNANNVSMIGLSGSDTLTANGGTQITLFGGTGNDLLQASGVTQAVLGSGSGDTQLAVSDSTEVTLFGGSGNSQLTSTNSNNVSMIGGSGNATLLASAGTSITLFGGSGNSQLTSANANNVSMVGGSGNATLTANAGTSITLFGGSGNDSLQAIGGSGLLLIGGTGSDTLATSGLTNATLFGGSGNSQLTSTNSNNVSMIGGSGDTTLLASGGTSITLFGGSGNSQLTSTNSNNVSMIGGSGSDTLVANAGTSITLFGGSGNSQLTSTNANNVSMIGGTGNATLLASGGTSITLFGGSGNSQLTSTNSNNVSMIGGSGNSSLTANAGTSITLFGGSGNDSLQAAGGSDLVLVGGSGNSQLGVSGSTGATLFGGSGSNTLTSTNSNNVSMIGGSGNATLTASGGAGVTLFGGDGSDSLASSNVTSLLMTGGAGRDTLTSANDTDAVLMSGGLSNDQLAETDGTNVAMMGGGGNDTLSAAGGTGISLSGLDGNNLYQLTGTPADPLDVALNDLGTFGSSIESTDGTSDGINTIAFPGVTSGITLDLSNASLGPAPTPGEVQQVAPGLTLSLTGYFQNVIGTVGANLIKGDSAANVLQGQGGNDTLIGGSGPSTLVAGSGSDVLMGGPGSTTYRFAGTGLGSVTVDPASDTSNDTLDFSQLGGAVTLDMTSAAAQAVSPAAGLILTITHPLGITGVVDTAFNDSITGNSRDDVFTVQGGNDTFTGGGGNDTYNFSAASRGAKILNETPGTNNALNFHAFDGPVNIDLTQSGPQVVSPGNLTLTLTPPTAFDRVIGSRFPDTIVGNDRGDTLIGGGGGDLITSGSGADYIQGGITQVVYLNFDAGSQPGYHVYTQAERDAVQARLEAIYKNFSFVFTQDPAQAAQLAQITGGQFATLNFNVGPYPGASHELDTENLDLGGYATINVNPALGSDPGLVPDTSDDVVGLTATIAAHELGHLVGLEHGDAFGPIGTGIYSGVDPAEFLPTYPGPDNAVDTPSDIMASPASVNSPLIDAAGPTQLGERDALQLAFNDNGTLLRAQDLTGLVQPVSGVSFSTAAGGVDKVTSAVALGELPQLAVPNTLLDPSSVGYGQSFQAVALGVLGTIANPGQEDFYAITCHAGEVMSFEVNSEDNSLNSRPFPPELVVLDGTGKVLGYSVRDFESGDPMILDVTLPADGTYYVGVDAFGGQATGDYRLLMYSLSAVSGGAPKGNGVTVYGSGGNDTLVGSSGDDTFIYQPGSVGQVTIQASSGADVLDLRRAPLVTYTLTGDPTLGTLTLLAAPTASNQSVTTNAGTPTAITLSSTDPNGDPLSYTITTQPTGGKLTGSGANWTYISNAGFSGSDSFQFSVEDTTTGLVSIIATVSITVKPSLSVAATYNSTVRQNVTSGSMKLATFNEAGGSSNAADYTATVSWGDGSSDSSTGPNVTIAISGTQVTVYGTHTFTTGGLLYPSVTLSYGVASASTAPKAITIDVGTDVTSQTKSSTTPYYYNPFTKLTTSTLTVTNTGNTNLTGEFYLVLQGLTPGVTLQAATITVGGKIYSLTIDTTATGDPMIVIPPSLLNTLSAGQSFKIGLSFSNPANKLIKFTTKLYSDPYDTL